MALKTSAKFHYKHNKDHSGTSSLYKGKNHTDDNKIMKITNHLIKVANNFHYHQLNFRLPTLNQPEEIVFNIL